MRVVARALAGLGWALLSLAAAAGLALSAAALLAIAPFARPAIASAVVGVLDDAIAGRLELQAIEVLPHGGLELRGLKVFDPDGHLVLDVGRARVFVDVTALRARTVGLTVELEAPSVLLEQEADGGISLSRALAPSHPRPSGAAPAPSAGGGGGWTLHLSRLDLHGGEVWWVDATGMTRLEAGSVDVVARGTAGPRRSRVEVRLRGELHAPVASPVALDLVATVAGDTLRVPVLKLEAGGTAVEAVAEGDIAARRGRAALTRLGISREQARALVPATPAGADVRATGYAESDGATLTAALRVEPAEPGGAGGRGDAAVAARLKALGHAAGFDVALDRLDPSRLAATAPAGEVTLSAHGAAAGTSLEDGRARLALALSRSRLRRGEVTRAEIALRVARGTIDLDRLSAAAPGLSVSGGGTWRRGGPVSGSATVDAQDLAAASRNLSLLLGAPAPAVGGRARLAAQLSGTADTPALSGTLDGPALRSGALSAEGVRVALRATGPLHAAEGQVEGRITVVRDGAREVARQVSLRAGLARDDATISVTAAVPAAGSEPLRIEARGRLGERREVLRVAELGFSYPGSRWALVRPATVDLRGPSVDRLEFADAPQRIAVVGGVGARGALAARVELSRLDLARLPPGLLDQAEAISGELSGSVEATGTVARPLLAGRASLEHGAVRRIAGLALSVDGRYDGAARRAAGKIFLSRDGGGTVDAEVDLPVPLVARPAERVHARIRAASVPVSELLGAVRSDVAASGTVAVELRVDGTAGAPALSAEGSLVDGVWRDLDGLGATLAVEAPGATLKVVGSASLAERRVVGVEAELPLDLGDLIARPAETLRAIERTRWQVTASLTSLDLGALSGRVGIPPGIAGTLVGHVAVSGTAAAPRGQATFDLTGGAVRGWKRLGAHVAATAGDAGLAAIGNVEIAGEDALRFQASLGLPPERLGARTALLAAALRVEAEVPRISLGRAAGDAVPLAGTLEGRVAVAGTLRAPEATAELAGAGVSIEGRPLGDARLEGTYARGRAGAEVRLSPPTGGTLRGTLAVAADVGVGVAGRPLRDAPAEATAVAEALDLGFLPALAPALVRAAGGQLTVDVHAQGPLARMSPRGTLHVAKGRLAIAELGEWTDIALDARVTDDVVELTRLDLRRGPGKLSATAAVRGLAGGTARVTAKLQASAFRVTRAGMDVATFDVAADATGTWHARELALDVNVPHGVVRLPKKTPRTLQSLEPRKDIVVGRRPERKAEAAPGASPASAASAEPLTLRAHVVVPRNLFVKGESPKVDVELKADVRYELTDGQDYAEGSVEAVRGTVEPIAGRNFSIERGRVQFTGGPPKAALLDIEAKYVNPAATATVNVTGAMTAPEIRLSSNPPMDDSQIAMLIATGRTELKAGSGAVGTLTGEEAGKAALGAIATQAFRNLVQDKLPLDTVALDSGQLRAGKYVTDKIYFGYVRRFDADPTKNENEDEVRVEYQITPRWMFESRYGNAGSGGASLVWTRDY